MTAAAPELLTIDRHVLIILGRVFAAALPDEGCALLLGTAGQGCHPRHVWHLRCAWPCLNIWPRVDQRWRRFCLDPREQLLAQRWARQRGLVVLGAGHSHPRGSAVPSQLDCALTLAPALLLIGAREVADHPDWSWGCWWLTHSEGDGKAVAPQQLPWTMVG